MDNQVSILNKSMELKQYMDRWTYDERRRCWCLEDLLYTGSASVPLFQRLSIFVPQPYLNEDGTINEAGQMGPYTARTVPVVFENNAAGYSEMPHAWLGGPRCYADQYLERGLIYVTVGCRGRESRDVDGKLVGKAPISLVDLKTALRFLRHNRGVLPGDWDKVISVGWSAGGAMSSLLAVSGDHERFRPYLQENGAFMDESDGVFAAQIYCPIVDLEHADQAYEWMFRADKENENTPAGAAEVMTPFKEALSEKLCGRYIAYFNGQRLTDPATGEALLLNEDGRSGSAYDYLMMCLNRSATDFLTRLSKGELPQSYTVQDYLDGNYTFEKPAPPPVVPGKNPFAGLPSLGHLLLRPSGETPAPAFKPNLMTCNGEAKHDWLKWDGERATISDLDSYVLHHRRRMKPCPSFDKLDMSSGENQVFGNPEQDYIHFNTALGDILDELAEQFPDECAKLQKAFAACRDDAALAEKVELINPLTYIGSEEQSRQASHYRIRVGASDADTSLSVSMMLALKLQNAGCGRVDYAMVWDQPHCEADYPGEVLDWIDSICQ